MDVTKLRWIEHAGSIYTEEAFLKRSEFTNKNLVGKHRIAIAFNVGQAIARHIVNTHNEQLTPTRGTVPTR
jgi:hypothetical protein